MEIILWLGVLFIGIPFIIGILKGSLETMTISDKEVNPVWAIVLLSIGAILVLMGFSNLAAGVFSSLKNFCLLIIKWLIGFPVLIIGIIKCVMVGHRDKWSKRITSALNGQLGAEIKKYIPDKAQHYWAFDDSIMYLNNENEKFYITFNELGYENIPGTYANVVCEWLLNNVITNPQNYKMDRICEQKDEWVSGTPDTIKTIETYDGYESYRVPGTDSYRTIEATIGYELIYTPPYEYTKPVKESLKKW